MFTTGRVNVSNVPGAAQDLARANLITQDPGTMIGRCLDKPKVHFMSCILSVCYQK
jgi:hypothetical protein